jgi:cell division protein FtsA
LRIRIEEKIPVARWDEQHLLSDSASVYLADTGAFSHLPIVHAANHPPAWALQQFYRLQARFNGVDERLMALQVDSRGALDVELINGLKIKLGRKDIDHKIDRLVSIYMQQILPRREQIQRLDLRYSNGFAVAWKKEALQGSDKASIWSNGNGNLIVGLDIGTSKVVAIVGEVTVEGDIDIIGIGTQPSRGLKKGVVVNIESTVQSIQRAVEEAELMAGCQIRSVYAGIAGSHVRSINSHGIVAIKEKEVTPADVARVIDAAKAVAIPADQRILHVLPQEFVIDSSEGIRDPISMSGVRLEAKVHLVTGAVSAAQNIIKCVRRCGLEVDDVILEQLASASSVLTDDEKELGVCLVDIGGGTTDIAVFSDGAIRHTAVIPIAGDQVTNDIAVALRTPTQYANDLKVKYACALRQLAADNETIEVPSVGDREPRRLARQTLAEVVEPRYEELLSLVQAELRRSGLEEICAAGVVMTGGSSKMEGAIELAEEIFHMPVRLGYPQYVSGLVDVVRNPIHATGVGLLLFGNRQQSGLSGYQLDDHNEAGVLARMKSWFQGNF